MAMPLGELEKFQNASLNQTNNRKPVRRERSSGPARSRAATAPKLEPVETETQEAETTRQEKERLELIQLLEMKRNELIERLDKGAARIEEARAQGQDVSNWEDYWIQLLRNYEKVCDQLAELNAIN